MGRTLISPSMKLHYQCRVKPDRFLTAMVVDRLPHAPVCQLADQVAGEKVVGETKFNSTGLIESVQVYRVEGKL